MYTPSDNQIIVGSADMMVSKDASATLVTYAVGSGVGVTFYDPVARVGGLFHAKLPDSTRCPDRSATQPWFFVDTGLAEMLQAAYALGAVKQRLVVKFAGGAEILDVSKVFNTGYRNIAAVTTFLARNTMRLHASNTGGRDSRTVRLGLATGAVMLDIPCKNSVNL